MKKVVGIATNFGDDYNYKPLIVLAGTKNSQETELIKDHFRRRHEQFAIKYGWEPISSDGMEQDGYDRFGRCEYILLANQAGRVGAGCRLIWSTEKFMLPVGAFLENHTVPVGSVEISRMTSTPEAAPYSLQFLSHLLGYLSERGVAGFYVTIRKRLLERYRHSGFNCYELLPGHPLEKTNRTGNKEYFLPVWIGIQGYQQALGLISRLCC